MALHDQRCESTRPTNRQHRRPTALQPLRQAAASSLHAATCRLLWLPAPVETPSTQETKPTTSRVLMVIRILLNDRSKTVRISADHIRSLIHSFSGQKLAKTVEESNYGSNSRTVVSGHLPQHPHAPFPALGCWRHGQLN